MSLLNERLCPNCKEGKFEEELCGAESTKTCTSCGYTTPYVCLQGPNADYGNSFDTPGRLVKKYRITLNDGEKILCWRQRAILNSMRSYLKRHADGDNLFQRAEMIFLHLVGLNKHARMPQKNSFAAAAVVTVLRKAHISVLLPNICKQFEAASKKTLQALKEIKESGFDEGTVTMDIKSCLGPLLEHHDNNEERFSIANRAVELSDLFYDLKLLGSRETMACVAMYFAVLSENSLRYSTMHASEFCKKYNVPASRSFLSRVSIVRRKIFILSKRLPWVSTKVKCTNCHVYIPDILRAKNTLMDNALGSSSKIDECEGIALTSPNEIVITEQMRLMMPESTIRNLLKPQPPPETPDPKFVSTSEMIGEDEISEEELKELIRSPEEVRILEKIRKRLED